MTRLEHLETPKSPRKAMPRALVNHGIGHTNKSFLYREEVTTDFCLVFQGCSKCVYLYIIMFNAFDDSHLCWNSRKNLSAFGSFSLGCAKQLPVLNAGCSEPWWDRYGLSHGAGSNSMWPLLHLETCINRGFTYQKWSVSICKWPKV